MCDSWNAASIKSIMNLIWIMKRHDFPFLPDVCVCVFKNKAAFWCSIWHVIFFFCFIKIHAFIACFRWRQAYVDATSVVVALSFIYKNECGKFSRLFRKLESERKIVYFPFYYFSILQMNLFEIYFWRAKTWLCFVSKEKGVRFYFYTRVIYDTTCREIAINLFID